MTWARGWAWVRVSLLLAGAACSHPAAPELVVAPPKAPGYLGRGCGGVAFYVSSGNRGGKCDAQVDDKTGHWTRMSCDDSHGNSAELACAASGEVRCKSAGTGICTTDEAIVQPAVPPPPNAIAHRCGGVAYFVLGAHCRATRDAMSGALVMNCDDGAGDSAQYACRDNVAACSATGDGVCRP